MTFRELYDAELLKPTPGQAFIAKIAEATRKSEATVKMWLIGRQMPDELTRSVIATVLGEQVDELFPAKQREAEEGGGRG